MENCMLEKIQQNKMKKLHDGQRIMVMWGWRST